MTTAGLTITVVLAARLNRFVLSGGAGQFEHDPLQKLGVETGAGQVGDQRLVSHVGSLRSDERCGCSERPSFSLGPANRVRAGPGAPAGPRGTEAKAASTNETADVAISLDAGLSRLSRLTSP